MSRRLCLLTTLLFLLAGCMELESDKFQAHRDALQRGESPDVYSRGGKNPRPQKPVTQEAREDTDEDENDAEEADKDRMLSALERGSRY